LTEEMRRELEDTRAELRRGILELPQETADSAAQMRRVIVDQIEALAELNRIVARHGRSLDAAEPPMRRVEAIETTASRRVIREEVPPLGTTAPRPEPPRAPRDITGMGAPAIPARRAEAPALSPAQQTGAGGRTGWLSDLLTRASQDAESPGGARAPLPTRETTAEPAGTDRPSIDSLDSLAVDIARMIDHDAAVDLWDRHQRGERNVFTRRLYTAQGQKTFDEIRRRYRKSDDFRETVDRYIDEFERLLEQVARDDRGQVLSKTYLTSDTGKVYTLLAHAAGRLN
jgi:hypothetical protein